MELVERANTSVALPTLLGPGGPLRPPFSQCPFFLRSAGAGGADTGATLYLAARTVTNTTANLR